MLHAAGQVALGDVSADTVGVCLQCFVRFWSLGCCRRWTSILHVSHSSIARITDAGSRSRNILQQAVIMLRLGLDEGAIMPSS